MDLSGLRKFALFGHSYGGFPALEYARRWPESLTHLILGSTSAGPVSGYPCDALNIVWTRARRDGAPGGDAADLGPLLAN
jgi:pimeloyl-ACP methyl ester carboxylesterase